MTLHNLRSPLGQLNNRTDLAQSWPNPDVSAQRATKGGGAHVQPGQGGQSSVHRCNSQTQSIQNTRVCWLDQAIRV
jgi:hypothetical protein